MAKFLTADQRALAKEQAQQQGLEGQRAQALLAVDDGATHKEAAEKTGLTAGQMRYLMTRFRKDAAAVLAVTQATPASVEAEAEVAPETPVVETEADAAPEPPVVEPEPVAEATSADDAEAPSMTAEDREQLLAELNELVEELKLQVDDLANRPEYTATSLRQYLKEKAKSVSPGPNLEVIQDLQAMLESTTPQDWVDPDTWKGMWYVVQHMAETESEPCRRQVSGAMKKFPLARRFAGLVYSADE